MGLKEIFTSYKELKVNVFSLNSDAVSVETFRIDSKTGSKTEIDHETFESRTDARNEFSRRSGLAFAEVCVIDSMAVVSFGYGLVSTFYNGLNNDSAYMALGLILYRIGLEFANRGVIALTQKEAVN